MKYKIVKDEYAQHPRKDFDVFATILYTSNRYELGDERVSAEEIQKKMNDPSLITLPVYAFIHGSVMLNTEGFNCPWDSGQCGCIYISKEMVRVIYGVKRISSKLLEQVLQIMRDEVKTYSQYLSGEVYGYRLLDNEGNEIDSCWGFYGREGAEIEAQEAMVRAMQYVPPSDKALAALNAGIESAKNNPPIYRTDNFAQYAKDVN